MTSHRTLRTMMQNTNFHDAVEGLINGAPEDDVRRVFIARITPYAPQQDALMGAARAHAATGVTLTRPVMPVGERGNHPIFTPRY